MKYVSRASWGARAYRLPSGAIQYEGTRRRGVKVHYLGAPYSDRPHKGCAAYVRSVQDMHMDGNGWSDIGYSYVVCTHGYVFEGRGLKRRNSANGNTSLNDQDYAVLALVGSSGLTKPTDPQLNGVRDAIEHCRNNGPAGSWIGGHRDGYPTTCPGDELYAWVRKGAPRPTEEDLPYSKKELAQAVWETDDVIKVPWGDEKNPARKPETIVVNTLKKVSDLEGEVAELKTMLRAISAKLGI